MNISVFGSGYVGLVTGACLAESGHQVVCVDIDASRVDALNGGAVPIFEPGLEPILERNLAAKRIRFTTDASDAVQHGDIIFIAVGTPSDEDGSADMSYVLAVAQSIGQHLTRHAIIVNKSTVPVGTVERVQSAVGEALKARSEDIAFSVVSNPEFLKEGSAIDDFLRPDRVVIGADDTESAKTMKSLYAPFVKNHDVIIVTDPKSAELTKYAANAMLATKISFMNEIANIAERLGADVEQVRVGIGSDPRIGYSFIYPGAGYGGSCFPKDVRALRRMADDAGHPARLLNAVEAINEAQKRSIFDKIHRHFDGDLAGKTVALWGLSFKPNTDDMREAPSLVLLESLWSAGASVQAYDPEAMNEARRRFGEREDLTLCESRDETLPGSEALVIITEWRNFWGPDFELIKKELIDPVIFDGRNILDPQEVRDHQITYYGIGRQ